MLSLSERRWRGSLITGHTHHSGEKNTRSLISGGKTRQAKWLLALRQTNTNEKPRHKGFALPLSSGVGGWVQQRGVWVEKEDTSSQGWKTFLAPLTTGAVAPERAPSRPPLKDVFTSVERRKQK